jgi:hypothetical protein
MEYFILADWFFRFPKDRLGASAGSAIEFRYPKILPLNNIL